MLGTSRVVFEASTAQGKLSIDPGLEFLHRGSVLGKSRVAGGVSTAEVKLSSDLGLKLS